MSQAPERPSSQADFWDVRYAREAHLFGRRPNAFIEAQAPHLPEGGSVVELGAGEARNAVYLALRGHPATAVDFSEAGLRGAGRLAHAADVPLRCIQADLRVWHPDERWDVVVATFVQLLTSERPAYWRLVQRLLKPGGRFLGVFFRPEQLRMGTGGPPTPDRMISAEELRAHFDAAGMIRCEEVVADLDEGPHMCGKAAVVQVVWEKG